MQRLGWTVFASLLLVLGCGGEKITPTQEDAEGLRQGKPTLSAFASVKDFPPCRSEILEGIYFDSQEKTLYVCELNGDAYRYVAIEVADYNGEAGDKGEVGNKGEVGDKGAQGDQGEVGAKGEAGDKGEQGDKGEAGDKGESGDKGETGDKGDKGDKGADA